MKDTCDKILKALESMEFCPPLGGREFKIIPLDADSDGIKALEVYNYSDDNLGIDPSNASIELHTLPQHYPYPKGAKGLIIFSYGIWDALHWFDKPGLAEVTWFQSILDVLGSQFEFPELYDILGPEETIRETLAETLQEAEYSLCPHDWRPLNDPEEYHYETEQKISIHTEQVIGSVIFQRRELTRLSLSNLWGLKKFHDAPGSGLLFG